MDIPQNYNEWKACITRKCKIALTTHYVAERIRVLSRSDAEETKKFRATYGEKHYQAVLSWFKQAAADLSSQ